MSTVGLQSLLSVLKPWAYFSLVFFLGILAAEVRLRIMARKNPGKKLPQSITPTSPLLIRSTTPRRQMDQPKGLPWISLIVVFSLGCSIAGPFGYYYRGSRDNRARYTYTEVKIIARHSDHEFTLQPARMPAWDTDSLCDSEDWQAGQKLISMTFSVRRLPDGTQCKDVERGGEWYRYMKDGKPIQFAQETANVR